MSYINLYLVKKIIINKNTDIMRINIICKGPILSIAGSQKHNLKKLSVKPNENKASDRLMGSNVFQ